MKRLLSFLLVMMMTLLASAQMLQPVKFSSQLKTNGSAEAEIIFTGSIKPGWHVYSTGLGNDGPTSATLTVNKLDGVTLVGKLQPRGHEISTFDKIFGMKLRYFEHNVTFVQKVRFTKPNYHIDAYLTYGACNDENCMPPSDVTINKSGKSPKVDGAAAADATMPNGSDAALAAAAGDPQAQALLAKAKADSLAALKTDSAARVDSAATASLSKADEDQLWKPVIDQLKAYGGNSNMAGHGILYLFVMGFLGGLLALVMPCIWPIIPMTVSFFLKRSKDNKGKGVRDAITYGISIIVIFLALGIIVTACFGSSALNALATSAGFNIFLFLLLVVFALSFFGWFEIKLPDSWGNKVDSKASQATGFLSIFLMAFTLVLVSFSCTAPIVGLLLVETLTSGNWLGPAVGMFGFALALAIPFSLFAMFPTLMKKSPKSGSWMTQIKVVLGFVELAFSLKFLSVADLAYGWHILDRETFLCLWIVIFLALGCYLVGWLKFRADEIGGDINHPMPVPAIMLGLCSIAFAIYMVPGLWGAPCKAVSAFAPPMNTQDFNLNTKTVQAQYTNYEEGMAAAKAQGKPVLLDFTGFGCVNCRKMEAAVWTDPRVAEKLTKDYVLISLFVDDKTPLAKPMVVNDNGQQRTLRTIGDKWSYLQSHKFGANAQPFYVAVDNEGNPLTASRSYKEDINDYLDFLNAGLEKYRNK
ncbi:protein-disulfide reductase DsbD family protein [Prevotella sp. AGR2160]|uniref:protein-disulfide reductase DsbD family protein n=1 Tax=Prevotella sp. AGR2160 TaxID=1280674 RepID=UPI0004282382|nr:cytochrome c biogenesis protein CcdA [Prevotella sp. AGR2160]